MKGPSVRGDPFTPVKLSLLIRTPGTHSRPLSKKGLYGHLVRHKIRKIWIGNTSSIGGQPGDVKFGLTPSSAAAINVGQCLILCRNQIVSDKYKRFEDFHSDSDSSL